MLKNLIVNIEAFFEGTIPSSTDEIKNFQARVTELKKLCANNGIQLIESISQDKAEVDLVNFVNNSFNFKIKNEVIEHKI